VTTHSYIILKIGFVVGFILLYVSVVIYLKLRFRRIVNLVFAKHLFNEPSLQQLNIYLDMINRETSIFMFSIDRLANIQFRDQRVSLIYGSVGFYSAAGRSGNIWKSAKSVYALADLSQSEWMRHNADVFDLAFQGSVYAIFWVKLSFLNKHN